MNIVLVNTSDVGQGAEHFTVTLHRELLKLGHHSMLLVGNKLADIPLTKEIPYRRGFPGSRRLARSLEARLGWQDIYNPSFRSLMKHIPPNTDIIHFNNLWGAQGYADIGALPKISRNVPTVLTEHQNWFFTGHCACFYDCNRWQHGCGKCPHLDSVPAVPKDGTAFNWRRKKQVVQKADITFVGVSDYVCKVAEQSPIWKGKRIERIYNGIDTDVFSPCTDETQQRLKKQLGIPLGRCAVLITGQALYGYMRGMAMEGYEALNRLNDPHIIPILVGKESADAAANLQIESVSLSYRKTAEQMADVYRACDMTLVTSASEAFGRIPAESQSCGTPVVTVKTGSLPEVVVNNVGGLVCDSREPQAIAECIAHLAHAEELRTRLGSLGRKYVQERFEIQMITEQYLALYQDILEAAS